MAVNVIILLKYYLLFNNFIENMAKTEKNNTETQEIVKNENNLFEIDGLKIPKKLPILPLRDVVIFPYMIFPVLVGRESSLKAANTAVERDKYIFLSAQKNPTVDEPTKEDIYPDGTVSKIIQILKLPNGLMKILVDGLMQARVKKYFKNEDFLEVEIEKCHIVNEKEPEFEAMIRHASTLFVEYVKNNRNIPAETLIAFENIQEALKKFYYIASNILVNVDTKQNLLKIDNLKGQFFELINILASELDVLKIEKEIDTEKVLYSRTDPNSPK
jgi:ATP-dependent Lon protease